MRKLLSILLAMYLAAGILPVQVMAEEAEQPAEEQTEVIEETEEITEETEEEQEELPEEETVPETEEPVIEETEIPEETAEPVAEETEIPEAAEEPVQTEEPVIEEVIPETEETVPVTEVPAEEPVPETEEPVIEPEVPAAGEIIPEPEVPVIEEAEPEPVPETVIPEEPAQTEAPAEEKKEEPAEVIEEISGEEAEVYEKKFTITYNANGGVFPDGKKEQTADTADDGEFLVGLPDNPYKEGYAFYGWYTASDMTASSRVGDWMTTDTDMVLYAGYKPCYTVTLDVNYHGYLYGYDQKGNYIDNKKTASYKIIKGMPAITGDTFTVYEPDGYLFTGWYLDRYGTVGLEANDYYPTGNVTLYANWVESDTIKVIYHGNGGKYNKKDTYTDDVRMSSPIMDIPEFKYSGKVLDGWYFDKELTIRLDDPYAFYPGYANKTGDPIDLYAKWVSPIKITLDANGGKILDKKTYVCNAAKGQALRDFYQEPQRSGYVFDGWYTSKDYTKQINIREYPFTASMTVYAKWSPAVKVTFKGGGKVWFCDYDDDEPADILDNAVYVIAKGYTFKDSCSRYGAIQIIGGATTDTDDVIPIFSVKDGYSLVGWYKDSALTKRFSFENDTISANTTVYPKIAKTSSLKTCGVLLDPNGGLFSEGISDHVSCYKNEYFTYSDYWIIPPAGKKFAGFTTKKNDASTLIRPLSEENTYIQTDYRVTAPVTLYAYFVPVYTVVLEGNGGYFRNGYYWDTAYAVKRTVGKGEKITDIYPMSEDTEGTVLYVGGEKILLGWYSDKECKNLVTHKLHQYAIKKDQTLYAKWGKPMKAGWKKTNGKWWYQCEDGSYYNEGLQKIGKKYYFFQSNGYIKTGWVQVGNAWYYFNTGGDAAVSWKKIGKVWYYFSSEGVMQKSWQKIGGKWYYFKASGAMVTGWQKIGKKWYWFESGGAMVTGWKKISGKWYWFDGSGVMITGWKKIGGKWYWFESGGAMFANGSKTIGGKSYKFDSNGVCLNP